MEGRRLNDATPRGRAPERLSRATYHPLQWFIDSYIQGDYRKEVTFFTSGPAPDGSTVSFAPHIRKFRPTVRSGREDENWRIHRYADVLLMYAEALNEQAQSDATISRVNQIRARARNGTGSENRTAPTDIPTGLTHALANPAAADRSRPEVDADSGVLTTSL